MNVVLERIDQLLEAQSKKAAQMCEAIGLPKSTYYTWKTSNRIPDGRHIAAIADYLDTTADYLLGRCEMVAETVAGYYVDSTTAEIANRIKENPGQKVLFDATKELSPDEIFGVLDFINQQNKKEGR